MKSNINPERLKLIQLSQEAKAIRQGIIAKAETEADMLAAANLKINDVLISMYQEECGATEFHTYKDWQELGYQVRKGEKSFRIWGRPRVATAKAEMDNVQTGEAETVESQYKLWPMACLFGNHQVEPIVEDQAA
jgi:antirestriction protein ArdC